MIEHLVIFVIFVKEVGLLAKSSFLVELLKNFCNPRAIFFIPKQLPKPKTRRVTT